jgi:hypothetical protein
MAVGGGCTFKIKGVIPILPDGNEEEQVRIRYMVENTKLSISTIGRPRILSKEKGKADRAGFFMALRT